MRHLLVSDQELALLKRALTAASKSEANAHMRVLEKALEDRAQQAGAVVSALTGASHALRSYQCGNASVELAESIADACDKALNEIGQPTGLSYSRTPDGFAIKAAPLESAAKVGAGENVTVVDFKPSK